MLNNTTEYIFYCKRAILFLSSSKLLTPHPPLRLASLSSHGNKGGGVTHSPGGEGDGGSIVWKAREIGFPSYSKICTLWTIPLSIYMFQLCARKLPLCVDQPTLTRGLSYPRDTGKKQIGKRTSSFSYRPCNVEKVGGIEGEIRGCVALKNYSV